MEHLHTYPHQPTNNLSMGNKAFMKSFSEKENNDFRATLASQLQEVAEICDKHNVKYFLDWGTLLGLRRDLDMIPFDSDNDIGIITETINIGFIRDIARIVKSKSSKMFYSLDELEYSFDSGMFLPPKTLKIHYDSLRYFGGKMKVTTDLFFYTRNQNIRYSKLGGDLIIRIDDNKLGDLTKLITKYGSFSVPYHIDAYLEDIYGRSWRTPDPEFKDFTNHEWGVTYENKTGITLFSFKSGETKHVTLDDYNKFYKNYYKDVIQTKSV